MGLKAKLIITYDIELPFTEDEAIEQFPDHLWPATDAALEYINKRGFQHLINVQGGSPEVHDLLVYEDD